MPLFPHEWANLFAVETPVFELMTRGALLYLGILVFMRILPRRTGGEVAHMDLIFMLLIAEGAAHSLGEYSSITEGLVVIATMMALNYAINALSFHIPLLERLVSHRPLEVIRDGEPNSRNMRHEFLTEDELMSYLRQNGVDDMKKVKIAMIEGKGKVSVVPLKD